MTTNPHAPARGLRALAQARTRRLLRALSYWYRHEPFLAPPRCRIPARVAVTWSPTMTTGTR